MSKALSSWFGLSLCILGYFYATSNTALAQVTSDGTVNTQVTENGNTAEITGGETRGDNLFHSFQDFSVPTGNEASFLNANDISNIFSRVTGGDISNIDGLISANGSANLFLINPAGIVFGEGARLDIGGSFYGSSASSILFEDGEFSTTDLDNPPLLTINAPIGLGFRDQPGDIVNNSVANNGRGLEVSPGNNISLLGGNVNFDGGRIFAPGGTVNLGGLTTAGTLGFADDGNLSFSDNALKADVSLTDNSQVDTTASGGGLIAINANNLELTQESRFLADIGKGLGSVNAVAGTIDIDVSRIVANSNSIIQAANLGIGKAGTININTDILDFKGGSAIVASNFGQGEAGVINVNAQEISFDQEWSGIYANTGLQRIQTEPFVSEAIGNAGEININTDTLKLTNGAQLQVSSVAQGDAGEININATGVVDFIGQGKTKIQPDFKIVVISGSFSQVRQDGVGDSGEVNITADSLTLIDKGAVLVDNSGVRGDAGDIIFDIQNDIFLNQEALILAQIQGNTEGNGGEININAGSLEAKGNSQILADTKGTGDAGNINLEVAETLSLDETSIILTEVAQDAVGNAGDITITANSLIVKNNADIASQTKGRGDAGKITITTNDAISLENSGEIRSLVDSGATGNGGDVSLKTGELNLTNQSQIISDTTGQRINQSDISTAGNISIDVTGDINLDNNSKIQSQTRDGAIGNAGDITINTGGSLFSTNGNLILADSKAQGNGGNITINAGEQIVLEGLPEGGFPSQIVAGLSENAKGKGGAIEIKAGELILDDVAFISSNTVSNSSGSAGNITIDVNSLRLSENASINVFTANDSAGGEIIINAQNLDLASGGKILAATDGSGNAGNINLNISDQIKIDNRIESSANSVDFGSGSQLLNDLQESSSGIYANTTENSTGDGGNVNIGSILGRSQQKFIISNNGQIIVDSKGRGNGGSIFIKSQALELDNNALISASTEFATELNKSGVVTLKIADDLTLNNNSSISARAFNDANGGNLNIDARFIIAFPKSNNDIIANAEEGTGGNININAESLLGIQKRPQSDLTNDINASSEFDLDGSVNVNTSDINPVQGATELPSNVVELQQNVTNACEAGRGTANNGLAIAGKGGVPPAPDTPLNSENIISSEQNPAAFAIPQPIETSQGKIQPARGIKVSKSGKISLTAYRTNNAGERIPEIKPNCN